MSISASRLSTIAAETTSKRGKSWRRTIEALERVVALYDAMLEKNRA